MRNNVKGSRRVSALMSLIYVWLYLFKCGCSMLICMRVLCWSVKVVLIRKVAVRSYRISLLRVIESAVNRQWVVISLKMRMIISGVSYEMVCLMMLTVVLTWLVTWMRVSVPSTVLG